MSVIPNADPSATNQYRDTTERSSKVMAGCSFYRFLCPICGKSKPVSINAASNARIAADMKPSAINGQKKTALDWLAGRAG